MFDLPFIFIETPVSTEPPPILMHKCSHFDSRPSDIRPGLSEYPNYRLEYPNYGLEYPNQ